MNIHSLNYSSSGDQTLSWVSLSLPSSGSALHKAPSGSHIPAPYQIQLLLQLLVTPVLAPPLATGGSAFILCYPAIEIFELLHSLPTLSWLGSAVSKPALWSFLLLTFTS